MSDLSDAADGAMEAMTFQAGAGFVQEYAFGNGYRRVIRGTPTEQLKAALTIEAVAARRTSGMHRLARFREDLS